LWEEEPVGGAKVGGGDEHAGASCEAPPRVVVGVIGIARELEARTAARAEPEQCRAQRCCCCVAPVPDSAASVDALVPACAAAACEAPIGMIRAFRDELGL
jgi:hypothetical protein